MNRLAIETSTELLSVAVSAGGQMWSHQGPGGAQASSGLLAAVHQVTAQAGVRLADLGVIAMGRGPGSFTGLRTACAVSQGLAFGLGIGILPIDTLLALAEEGRFLCGATGDGVGRFYAALDARMGQLYTAAYEHQAGRWRTVQAPAVQNPRDCRLPTPWAGHAVQAVGLTQTLLPQVGGVDLPWVAASPTAMALLRLADQARADGCEVAPALALPLYLRDKVAQTTAERALAKAVAGPA
ncbi:MAG: tRNA (adenosine(37)-N6)-threonylcarbamoyltransferase complex dimerization subunit type 1 TsaB [Betaproteobacteria bacterium]|nr:tRNA (adenosine(37)-N6)-threonylcarbamoyltransferase complex dimerization subunit type 1 TsaB [Betaproteobacteria bacterium]NBY05354.1 tRNA (adenosine(37)-N6)-threonylcarbamoyltransferase complex dimerization subunit type 1 TsaB [Betaproteobacteria bacterium]